MIKPSALKISLVALAVFASANAADPEYEMISDRLAYNEDFDPTTVFLSLNQQETDVEARDQLVSDIIDYAETFLGCPYRRGSKGPSAFDCSGFTGYVFKNFGIKLGASSGDQYRQGTGLELEEVEPGDLVFFSGAAGGKSRVGHVGMVVDVDDNGSFTFIHAATSGGIRYDVYPDGGYYSRRYIGARRLID